MNDVISLINVSADRVDDGDMANGSRLTGLQRRFVYGVGNGRKNSNSLDITGIQHPTSQMKSIGNHFSFVLQRKIAILISCFNKSIIQLALRFPIERNKVFHESFSFTSTAFLVLLAISCELSS
jgi:hypothetical protein